jgi:hypothetical protein
LAIKNIPIDKILVIDSAKANKVNKGEKKMPDKKPKKDDKKKTVPKKKK